MKQVAKESELSSVEDEIANLEDSEMVRKQTLALAKLSDKVRDLAGRGPINLSVASTQEFPVADDAPRPLLPPSPLLRLRCRFGERRCTQKETAER